MSDIKNIEFSLGGNNQEVKENPLANLVPVKDEAKNKTIESRKVKENSDHLLPIGIMHEVEGSSITFSDPINLNGEVVGLTNPQIQLLEMQPGGSEDTVVSGLFLSADLAGKQTPVGYVVFTWGGDTTTHASMNINHLKRKKVQEQLLSVPQPLQEAVAQSDLFEALKTNPEMRGKGLGKLLFLAGAARMRDLGFEEIEITGDLTIGKAGDSESFYTNMGAKVDPDTGHEIVTLASIDQQTEYIQQVLKQTFSAVPYNLSDATEEPAEDFQDNDSMIDAAKSKRQQELEAGVGDVADLIAKYNVAFLHGINPLNDGTRNTNEKHIKKDTGLKGKLAVLLTQKPHISTSTFKPGDGMDNIYFRTGIVVTEGRVEIANDYDAGTWAEDLKTRGPVDYRTPLADQIDLAINNRHAQGLNELTVNNARVGGFYICKDPDASQEARGGYDYVPDEAIIPTLKDLELPLYVLKGGKIYDAEINNETNSITELEEISLQELSQRKYIIPPEKRERIEKLAQESLNA